jgi:hypothetical protein
MRISAMDVWLSVSQYTCLMARMGTDEYNRTVSVGPSQPSKPTGRITSGSGDRR